MRALFRFPVLALAAAALLGTASGQTLPPPAPRAPAASQPPSPQVLALREELRRILREPGWENARYGVLVVSLDRGDTLFSLNPDLPLAPASNLKLFSTAAALYYLGPEFRYATYLLGTGDVRDGVLHGDLVLYGTGDPSISGRLLADARTALRQLADSLVAQGVREVRGDLVGDGSYFDDAWVGEGWGEENRRAWYGAPVGALSFAENLVTVQVLPGAPGEPARIRTTPATQGLAVINQVRTVARGASRVRFRHGPEALVVEGQIARGSGGVSRGIPVVDPANFAAAAFHQVLAERGIQVAGRVRSVRHPSASPVAMTGGTGGDGTGARVLAIHLSPPLDRLAEVTNHVSHNLFADAMLKTAGRVALGEGSFAAGERAVRYFLECEFGTDPASLRLLDGSGLSHLNRVTARTIVQLLDFMPRSDVWESFHASLPQAADPRGLRRMQGTPAAGNLRAKTGTIRNVSSLSGYVRTADGERLAFSIIANAVPSTWRAKRMEDVIGARLAGFRRNERASVPDAATIGATSGAGASAAAARQTSPVLTVR